MESLDPTKVKTKEDFIKFISYLKNDFIEKPDTWENRNLEDFLEAMSGWSLDMDGYYNNLGQTVPQEPSWKLFAEILLASKYYE